MARYRLKRKTFGIFGETAGGAMDATGKTLNNGIVSTGVGVGAAMSPIGDMASTALSGVIPGGSLIGRVAAYKIGKEATKSLGQGLSDAGKDLQAQSSAGV
jgi:hypothetical protein